ncbi:hypothetical protein HORIV_20370 [Vreelandella olivaria]|uniref:Uncharacterized protein n=1 Tax=Vreelandella olivaria TaxID=390919 RepID=A0ABM7GGP4_9GAMM|nr:hypothetical protein HORIV_20370 [Halomonas olivaria]
MVLGSSAAEAVLARTAKTVEIRPVVRCVRFMVLLSCCVVIGINIIGDCYQPIRLGSQAHSGALRARPPAHPAARLSL